MVFKSIGKLLPHSMEVHWHSARIGNPPSPTAILSRLSSPHPHAHIYIYNRYIHTYLWLCVCMYMLVFLTLCSTWYSRCPQPILISKALATQNRHRASGSQHCRTLYNVFSQESSELQNSARNSCRNFGTAMWIRSARHFGGAATVRFLLESIWVRYPSPGVLGTRGRSWEVPDKKERGCLTDLGTILGSMRVLLESFPNIFNIKLVSFCKLFLSPLPQSLQDQFGIWKLPKGEVVVKVRMWLNRREYFPDLIFT